MANLREKGWLGVLLASSSHDSEGSAMNLFLDGRSLAMRITGGVAVIHIVLPGSGEKNFVLGHATKNKHFLKSGII